MEPRPSCWELEHKALQDLIDARYPAIASRLLRPLLDLTCLARETCAGDADKYLIILVVGIRTAEHARYRSFTPEQLESGEIPVLPTLGTNVRSIAESTQMPKESVRRKVAELVEAGWIARHGNELHMTGAAYQQLDRVRAAVRRLAVENFATVASLIRESDDVRD